MCFKVIRDSSLFKIIPAGPKTKEPNTLIRVTLSQSNGELRLLI